jgi:hypothetical protein
MISGDFSCKSSISNTSCTYSMSEHEGMRICLSLGEKCKGLTYNLGPNTITLKRGDLKKPKFTMGVITILKNEHKDILDFEEEVCAQRTVSYLYGNNRHPMLLDPRL